MKARIYYHDGSVYEDEPRGAPPVGVQAIVSDDPGFDAMNVGRLPLYGYDLYIYCEEHGWIGTDKWHDLVEHVRAHTVTNVLYGMWIETTIFRQILKRAENDPGFREMSGVSRVHSRA